MSAPQIPQTEIDSHSADTAGDETSLGTMFVLFAITLLSVVVVLVVVLAILYKTNATVRKWLNRYLPVRIADPDDDESAYSRLGDKNDPSGLLDDDLFADDDDSPSPWDGTGDLSD